MPVTKWDKVYLGIVILSIVVFLGIYVLQGDINAQKVAQEIMVPIISVLLLIGIGIQRIARTKERKPS